MILSGQKVPLHESYTALAWLRGSCSAAYAMLTVVCVENV